MDPQILTEKLEALRRCIRRIEERRLDSAEALVGDVDAQDILSLNLTRSVQLCVDMALHVMTDQDRLPPDTMAGAFDGLTEAGYISSNLADRMRAAVGFRNIAVHSYQAIDWAIVHHITHQGLDDFRQFAAALADHLPE